MLVPRLCRVVGVNVRVCIDPDNIKILKLLQAGQNSRTREGVIPAKSERLRELVACLV